MTAGTVVITGGILATVILLCIIAVLCYCRLQVPQRRTVWGGDPKGGAAQEPGKWVPEEVLGTRPWVDTSGASVVVTTCHFTQGFGQGSERVWPLAQGTQLPRERAEVSTAAPYMPAPSPMLQGRPRTHIFPRVKREPFVQSKAPG